MTRLTKLLALFSFATLAASTSSCGRSDLLSYAGEYGPDGGVLTDAQPDTGPKTHCTSSDDCGSTPATPYCELPPGVCVACLTDPDTCPTGEACNPTTHTCQPLPPGGCTSNAQCPATKPICDTQDGECVGCTESSQCPTGDTCIDFECVPLCSQGGECGQGLSCCTEDDAAVCIDEGTDPDNCGGCGRACPAGETCLAGACQSPTGCDNTGCVGTDACCNDVCVNVEVSNIDCGGCNNPCPPDTTCTQGLCLGGGPNCNGAPPCEGVDQCCSDGCTDITSDPDNCGGCNNICPDGSECFDSVCQGTMTGCNGGPPCLGVDQCCGNGCTDTNTDPNNCSQCGFQCPTGNTCVQGNCTPPASCNGGPVCMGVDQCCQSGCTDVDTDPSNCGQCGFHCPPSDTCVAAVCTAPASCNGGPVCTGVDQCCQSGCADVDTDPNNCGQCGMACAPGATCTGAVCVTPPSCNGGPVCTGSDTCCANGCTNTATDVKNCGQCGNPCALGDTCVAGVCTAPTSCNGGPACVPTDMCCSTGCLDTTSDPSNCGGCGTVCATGDSCIDSSCVSNEGVFNPTVNPTYLSPGVHSYTSINIPAGVTVYVAGAGANSGTLDLEAAGTIEVDGIIDVSGGPGTQNTITSQNTEAGEAGAGGFTGEPYQSAAGSTACGFVGGNGGSLGDGVAGTTGSCFVASSTTCIQESDQNALLFTTSIATYGGGGGIFTGYRAYGAGGGGPAGGAPGALGAAYPGEDDCSGVSGGGGAVNGAGGAAPGSYKGSAGMSGQTQCPGSMTGVPPAYVGGGGGGSIGAAAAADLPVATTFQTGSSGGGGSADYLNRPEFGGTSGGGGGGGALKLGSTTSITIKGELLANGGVGGDAVIGTGSDADCNPQPGAAGGGGSGGVIYLSAPTVAVASGATVSAAGGSGGAGSEFATGGAGGSGGLGRVRLSTGSAGCSGLSGSFTPGLPSGCPAGTATSGKAYVGTYPN